jgi:hypothetical protein
MYAPVCTRFRTYSVALDPVLSKYCETILDWDLMREWFDDPAGVQVPDNDEFQGDVCAPVRGKGATGFDSAGRLLLESKEHIKERLGFSPDYGDAGALTFAVDYASLQEVDWASQMGDNFAGSGAWMGA